MAVQTVQKVKSTKTCRSCGGNVAGNASKCQNCNSTDLAKSIVIIRKSEATGEDANTPDSELASETSDRESEETDDELEDLEEDDFEPSDEEDEDDEDEDDEDEEDDEEDDEDSEDEEAEEDDEDEQEDKKVTKKVTVRRNRRVAKSAGADMESVELDILLAALTVGEDVSKAIADGSVEGDDSAYERAMTAFNNVMDAGAPSWVSGESISKEDKAAKLKRLKARVAEIRAKLKDSGDDEPDEDDVEKSDIFKGLTPAAAAILKNAQLIQERDKAREYEEVAKSFGELTTPTSELGPALRVLADTDKNAYDTITKTLRAAAEASRQSDIFKAFGSPQGGMSGNGGGEQNLDAIAKSIQSENKSLTTEQAYAEAINRNPHLYDAIIAGR